jgi:choice-of-anchor A domain-containing protein
MTLRNLTVSNPFESRAIVCGLLISKIGCDGDTVLNFDSTGSTSTKASSTSAAPGCLPVNNDNAETQLGNDIRDKCDALESQCNDLTCSLQNLLTIAGNTVDISTSKGTATFTVNKVDANGVAVFNSAADRILNNVDVKDIQVQSNVAKIEALIINLSGTNIKFSHGQFSGGWFDSTLGISNTIWNLYECTSLEIHNKWVGGLLAPNAVVETDQLIEGAVIAKSLITTNTIGDSLLYSPQTCTSDN